ncbi:MAG: hypothetical protein FWG38_11185 [Defluviitaleaceae bacterium]|jgi:hypothetical protein|nr:hypothetical protein [Defluviitaleaceae bacterium]
MLHTIISNQGVAMPTIPKAFIDNDRIRQVLCYTASEFNYEEKRAIFLYCVVKLSIDEIATHVELPIPHVVSALVLYAQRLNFKLDVFKKAVPYDKAKQLSVMDLFEREAKIECA